MAELIYNPGYFDAAGFEEAKRLSLPADYGGRAEERWEKETPWIFDAIAREMTLKKDQLVLDYGCGVGRLARELCNAGCRVVGVDPSDTMRRMATEYVGNSERFIAVSIPQFDLLVKNGLRCDAALALWTLQHVPDLENVCQRIFNALKMQAILFIANYRDQRLIPVVDQNRQRMWYDDGARVWEVIAPYFGPKSTIPLPYGLETPPERVLLRTYMKTFSKY